jgi:hypothetical protein
MPKMETAAAAEFPAVVHIVPAGGVPVFSGKPVSGIRFPVPAARSTACKQGKAQYEENRKKMFLHANLLSKNKDALRIVITYIYSE